ncbi:MAG TPA: dUTP diphosphatase [Egibacteraceae bacterium]|nr:dUTP diphosphatase [Egibacteraceae bacterium]
MERNQSLDPALVDALVELWAAVSNAGGAVGFVPPVTLQQVRPTAEAALARVAAGTDDLVVARDDADSVIGLGFLASSDHALSRHVGTVRRLQRHPERVGAGVGARLLAELEAAARDRGMSLIALTVRGGTGRERFYLRHGYRIDARLPARLRISEDDLREELVMSKSLDASLDLGSVALVVRRLDSELPLPSYAHPGDAGLDLRAAEDVALAPGERATVRTGIAVAIPDGHVGLVHPRSGLAARHGLGLVNSPGTIDSGYRGEIKVILINLDSSEPVTLSRGDRVAQLVIQRVETPAVVEVSELPESPRGEGGFGSTGR